MKKLQRFFNIAAVTLFLGLSAVVTSAQTATTSGTVTMSGSVSDYVDLTAGGGATLSGSSGGSVTTNNTSGNPINVVANLGELGPSNTNSLVKLTVPIRVRSNVAYIVNMQATVDSGLATRGVTGSDVGFGVAPDARSGVGVNTGGSDTGIAVEPTDSEGAADGTSGRWGWTNAAARLSSYSTASSIMNGDYVLDPVPTSNTSAVTANTFFAIKPQFFQTSNTTINVTYTIVANP